ncbi:MAG: PDZ domain-containing protein [Thermonemataceae bacterium]|nr:PDZ domain-containing protein [Thermonemataceae bacterium]
MLSKIFTHTLLIISFFGVLQAQNLQRRLMLGIDISDKNNKIFITRVIEKTPAEKMGLQTHDEITHINNEKIKNYNELNQILKKQEIKKEISLRLIRNGQIISLKGKLQELPKEHSPSYQTIYGELPTALGTLRTILTLPKHPQKTYPAVLFIQGVGCYPIDTPFDTTYGHSKMMRDLSAKNIITLRIDKSGVGDSQGTPCEQIDFQSEVSCFLQALQLLKNQPFVDKNNIFIVGHSLGGLIAPIIAQKENIKGIAVYGTIGQNWVNYLIDSRRALALAKGESEEDTENWTKTVTDCSVRFFLQRQSKDSIEKQNADCVDFLQKFSFRKPNYWYQLSDVNVAEQWANYNGFVLTLWGEYDKASTAAEQEHITNIINKKIPYRAAFLKIAHTDHKMSLLSPENQQKIQDYNPQITQIIYDWLREKQEK